MIHPSDITLTDDFCGVGGSTQGAKQVPGVRVKYARNHWPLAIRSHNSNHPETDHDCVNLSETHPGRYERTSLYIASPECTYHSNSSGRKRKNLTQTDLFKPRVFDPAAIKSRATMWDVVTFAEYHRHEIVIVENVVQVRDWALFDPWLRAMHNLGYHHECVYLNAQFAHGVDIVHYAPQSRDRIYIVFWKKGNRKPDLTICPKAPCARCGDVEAVQSWKLGCRSKVYGEKGGYLYRCPLCGVAVLPYYYAAVNCLDLSIPMVKIGERMARGLRPLSANTLARIEYGLRKYGLRPTVLDQRNPSSYRVRSITEALHTQTTQKASYLFSPFILANRAHANPLGVDERTPTVTGRNNDLMLLSPFLLANREHSTPRGLTDATHTITGGNHQMLISPFLTHMPLDAAATQQLADSLPTIASRPHQALIAPGALQHWLTQATPFLQPYHGGSAQAGLPTDPVSTIPTKDSIALIEAHEQPRVEDCYFRMFQPHETAKAQGFPSDYIILGTKDEQQKQIGNANPPSTMELLVRRSVSSLL